jgi:septum formation protein
VNGVPRLILASASPARRNLLAAAGFDATAIVSGVDESTVDSDSAEELSMTLARLKAEAVASQVTDDVVVGCDSVLAFDGGIYGKPGEPDVARERWYAMRGRSGTLHTGHCVLRGAERAEGVATTVIRFAEVSDAEIDAYVATGEPLQVAGGFTIDGRGSLFVDSIEGDATNVIGLSLPLLRKLLAELGLSATDFWKR